MPRYLTLSRAASLVGVKRSEIQKKIQAGELETFEGSVEYGELLRVFPAVDEYDTSGIKRLKYVMESAWSKVRRDFDAAPDIDAFMARVSELSKQLSYSRANLKRYEDGMSSINNKLRELIQRHPNSAELKELSLHIEGVCIDVDGETHIPEEIIGDDTYSRIMAAQVQVLPSKHRFLVEGMDTILEAALHAGHALSYGCSNGNCGECKAKLLSGEVKKIRNHDYVFSEAEKQDRQFLTCCHTANTDIVIEAQEAVSANDIPHQQILARVKKIENLNDRMRVLSLRTPRSQRLRFLAGQRIKLNFKNNLEIVYPIASCPCDDRNIQFHIDTQQDDVLAEYIRFDAKNGDVIKLEGPLGEAVWLDELTKPIVFIALDTGFAPMKSIIEHLVTTEYSESITLVWISCVQHGHYMGNLCRSWKDAFDNFNYCALHLSQDDFREKFIEYVKSIGIVEDSHNIYIAAADDVSATIQHDLVECGIGANSLYKLEI